MTGHTRTTRKTKVLFLAWGYSIHARRRIQLFIDDPEFEVAVVSNYNYNFCNANNVLLSKNHLQEIREATYSHVSQSMLGSLFKVIRKGLSMLLPLRFCYDVYIGFKDFKILKNAVKEFEPEVIFLQTLLYPSYLAFFLPRSLPIVITFWNGDVTWWAKWNGIERSLKKQIVVYGVRRARAITVNSQAAFNACLGYGTQAEKIHLIRYPGVELEHFKPLAKDEARKKLDIPFPKIVLSPRGLGGYLNSDIIVESAAFVVKKHPDTLFLFSGVWGEAELKKHQRMARRLGIEKHFRWDGQVPWDMMPLCYNAADVMVSISSNDSLPNCMLEAMACGVPVIMGDIPQVREWVSDGVNGFLVPPRDPVALSDRISAVLEGAGGKIDAFVKASTELVMREADSKKNIKKVKDLVKRIAEND